MPIFHDRLDPYDNEAFLAWIAANPSGYYLNQKKSAEAMLHRGKCFHIEFNIPVRLTAARKIASTNRQALERWAASENIRVTNCSDCL
jgi:hypothetical protein